MKTILVETHVAAPPERVWALIADFAGLSAWNPFVIAIEGEQRAGAPLAIRLRVGGRDVALRARLSLWRPGRALRWTGGIPLLFRGEHFVEVEPAGAGTRLRHGERFRGIAPALLPRGLFDRFRADYAAMNAALEARAEADGVGRVDAQTPASAG